jgi:hypothetical protein
VPISGVVTVGVFGDFTEDFIVTLTRTEYSQTYPYTGQTTATKEYIEANNTRQLLNEQINTYRDKSHYNKVLFGDFTEDFIVTCGVYSNSADIAVVINIGLTGDNGDEW